MGVINSYFIARTDAEAAASADTGPDRAAGPVLDAVDPTVQAGTLMALLTDRDYEEIVADKAWAKLVSDPMHESAWVMSMPSSFTDALAGATPDQLSAAAQPWSQTDEFWGAADPADLIPMLIEWRSLARVAREREAAMYCWAAL